MPANSAAGSRSVPSVAVYVATAFGLGYSPVAPGTAGSLAGVALYAGLHYGMSGTPLLAFYLGLSAALIVVALWSTDAALPKWGGRDPQAIVIDEVAGQWLTFAGPLLLMQFKGLAWSPSWKTLAAGFVLFRLFDIAKPSLARRAERLAGSGSIVYDDLVAGVYAGVLLAFMAFMGWLNA